MNQFIVKLKAIHTSCLFAILNIVNRQCLRLLQTNEPNCLEQKVKTQRIIISFEITANSFKMTNKLNTNFCCIYIQRPCKRFHYVLLME
jgi:hypothetical protein